MGVNEGSGGLRIDNTEGCADLWYGNIRLKNVTSDCTGIGLPKEGAQVA